MCFLKWCGKRNKWSQWAQCQSCVHGTTQKQQPAGLLLTNTHLKPWGHLLTLDVSQCYSVLVRFVDDLVNPSQEPANTCVHPREWGVSTTVTPGDDSCQHPTSTISLANQWTPAVTLATIHTVALRQAPSTQHAACETITVSLLTLPGWKQGDPGLEQSPGVLWIWEQEARNKSHLHVSTVMWEH